MMPGQNYPTYIIAQPTPLPCQSEGIHWPSHNDQALLRLRPPADPGGDRLLLYVCLQDNMLFTGENEPMLLVMDPSV